MIRFRPRQLDDLPSNDKDIQVILPTGRVVAGHFRRNQRNPNVSGPELVGYIKRVLDFGETQGMLIEQVSPNSWRLYQLEAAVAVTRAARGAIGRVRNGDLQNNDIRQLLSLADAHDNRTRRMQQYQRLLRPPALRRLMLSVVGVTCQVEGCDAAEDFTRDFRDEEAGTAVVEVHHIEAVARCNDHHPRNLCVLCANHHRLIHGWGSWTTGHDGQNVFIRYGEHELLVVREGTVFGEVA